MKILISINQNGEPLDIRFVPMDMYSYCDVDSLITWIEFPYSHNDLILFKYYWKDSWKIRQPKPNKYYYWNNILEVWDSNLLEAKILKKEEVNKLREQILKYNPNSIQYNGNFFSNDSITRNNISESLNLLNAGVTIPEGFVFRTKDNINIPFNADDIKNLAALSLFYKNACYQHSWELKNQIDQLTTVEEIEAFDINVGWP